MTGALRRPRARRTKRADCFVLILAAALFAASAAAQVVKQTGEPRVTERGPHHRVIERTLAELQPDGSWRERKSSYTELATGLHYQDEQGRWQESREEIQILNGSAIAAQSPIQVIFAANLNSAGAIDLLAPGGERFRSHVLGIFYTDYASGKSVLIARVKDSIGAVLPPNQVIYQDAFSADFVADVRLTCTKSSFEQDVILVTAPPSPAEWGLSPETTRLEVMSEFLEAPEARVTSVVLNEATGWIDQHLDFGGGLIMEQGQAFPLGEASDPFSESAVPTAKSLERIDGRLILIEQVDYPSVRGHLGRLPKSASINKERKVGLPEPGRTMMASLLPVRPSALAGKWQSGQYAKVDAGRKGFVLDYITSWTSSLTNYVLKGDTTYFITNSATVSFHGTTVLEGGAVIKTGFAAPPRPRNLDASALGKFSHRDGWGASWHCPRFGWHSGAPLSEPACSVETISPCRVGDRRSGGVQQDAPNFNAFRKRALP